MQLRACFWLAALFANVFAALFAARFEVGFAAACKSASKSCCVRRKTSPRSCNKQTSQHLRVGKKLRFARQTQLQARVVFGPQLSLRASIRCKFRRSQATAKAPDSRAKNATLASRYAMRASTHAKCHLSAAARSSRLSCVVGDFNSL